MCACLAAASPPPAGGTRSPGASAGALRPEGYLSYIDVAVLASYPVGFLVPAGYPHRPVVGVEASPAGGEQEAQPEGQQAQQVRSAPDSAAALPAHLGGARKDLPGGAFLFRKKLLSAPSSALCGLPRSPSPAAGTESDLGKEASQNLDSAHGRSEGLQWPSAAARSASTLPNAPPGAESLFVSPETPEPPVPLSAAPSFSLRHESLGGEGGREGGGCLALLGGFPLRARCRLASLPRLLLACAESKQQQQAAVCESWQPSAPAQSGSVASLFPPPSSSSPPSRFWKGNAESEWKWQQQQQQQAAFSAYKSFSIPLPSDARRLSVSLSSGRTPGPSAARF
uniref:uncharacterized protein LOC114606310 n=1 Tax=Podarcis muralis TaxID=64176 RepID=UPI00109FFD20|nr:uncharacterized protein LOC114606310 [Podarcis muralis]